MIDDLKTSGSNLKLILLILFPFVGLALLSIFFGSTQSLNLLPPQVDIAATAQSLQLRRRQAELEVRIQERLQAIQDQIDQNRQMLETLHRSGGAEQSQLENYLSNLQAQVEQAQSEINQAQMRLDDLQQAAQADEIRYQKELEALEVKKQQVEAQLQAELEAASAQLSAANKPAEYPPATPSAPPSQDVPTSSDKRSEGLEHEHEEHEEEADNDED